MEYQGLDVRTAGATGWWHILHGIAMGSGHRLCLITLPPRWPQAELQSTCY